MIVVARVVRAIETDFIACLDSGAGDVALRDPCRGKGAACLAPDIASSGALDHRIGVASATALATVGTAIPPVTLIMVALPGAGDVAGLVKQPAV